LKQLSDWTKKPQEVALSEEPQREEPRHEKPHRESLVPKPDDPILQDPETGELFKPEPWCKTYRECGINCGKSLSCPIFKHRKELEEEDIEIPREALGWPKPRFNDHLLEYLKESVEPPGLKSCDFDVPSLSFIQKWHIKREVWEFYHTPKCTKCGRSITSMWIWGCDSWQDDVATGLCDDCRGEFREETQTTLIDKDKEPDPEMETPLELPPVAKLSEVRRILRERRRHIEYGYAKRSGRDIGNYTEEYITNYLSQERYLFDLRWWRNEAKREEIVKRLEDGWIDSTNAGHADLLIQTLLFGHKWSVERIADLLMGFREKHLRAMLKGWLSEIPRYKKWAEEKKERLIQVINDCLSEDRIGEAGEAFNREIKHLDDLLDYATAIAKALGEEVPQRDWLNKLREVT